MGDSLYPAYKLAFHRLIMSCFEMEHRFTPYSDVDTMQHLESRDDETLHGRGLKMKKSKKSNNHRHCDEGRDKSTHQPIHRGPKPQSIVPPAHHEHSAHHQLSYPRRGYNMQDSFTRNYQPTTLPFPRTPPPIVRGARLCSPFFTYRVTQLTHMTIQDQFKDHGYPVQHRYFQPHIPKPIRCPSSHRVVGDPSLRIYRIHLPTQLLQLLDEIVWSCERYAATLSKGWYTNLYSLTKQDIALRDIPDQFHACKPITSYIRKCMMALWGVSIIKMDRSQPHILKYSADEGHTGVELHHDKCDITANLCLSKPKSYIGGGYVASNTNNTFLNTMALLLTQYFL
jgi:hypothetical protein